MIDFKKYFDRLKSFGFECYEKFDFDKFMISLLLGFVVFFGVIVFVITFVVTMDIKYSIYDENKNESTKIASEYVKFIGFNNSKINCDNSGNCTVVSDDAVFPIRCTTKINLGTPTCTVNFYDVKK